MGSSGDIKKKVHERTDARFVRKLLLLLAIYLSNFSPIESRFFCQLKKRAVDLLANKETKFNSLYSAALQTDIKRY